MNPPPEFDGAAPFQVAVAKAEGVPLAKMLGGTRYEDPSMDEALAARVASL